MAEGKKSVWQPYQNHKELYWGRYVVPNFMSNSMALNAGSNKWIVMSPGASLLSDFFNLIGDSKDIELSLVMPNAYHFLGIQTWLDAFPNAKLFASSQAIPMLNKKGINNILSLEQGELELPEHYHLLFPPGHKGGDVWFVKSKDDKHLWITCDSFLNYKRLSNQPIARLMQKIMGAAPGLKISLVIKYFILNDRKAFKHWVADIIKQYPPIDVLPSHGEPTCSENLANDLAELFDRRL